MRVTQSKECCEYCGAITYNGNEEKHMAWSFGFLIP